MLSCICRHAAAVEKVRAEGRSAAESARGDVVEPLKEEVERMRQQLEEAQAMYEVCTHAQTPFSTALFCHMHSGLEADWGVGGRQA